MTKKILIITICEQCYWNDKNARSPYCNRELRSMQTTLKIPDWCPLDNATEK